MSDDELQDIYATPSTTPNFKTELAAQLSELIPEAIADGKVDVEKLKELLGDDAGDDRERFGLFWAGKKRALRAAQEATTATLKPDFENSKDWDATKNVFIEGDNLEVLKILQKHYHGKIKVIYIDPPYNTGKDFVYPDNFKEGVDTYLEWTKQVNEEGRKVSTNSESEGRYHSNWLNMMYPRLKLARNLLTADGVIFISIDDHEVANLRLVLDSVFGESNFVENYIWESNFRPDNSSRVERENAQHILCYARSKVSLGALVGAQKATEGLPSLTKSSMKESTLRLEPEWVEFQIPDGEYRAGDLGSGYRLETDVVITDGVAEDEFLLTGRVIWSQSYLETQIADGTKIVIKGKAFVPYSRKVATSALAPTTLIPRDAVGDVLAGNAEIKALFGEAVFNHPKPISLLKYLVRAVTSEDKEALVLDFFAGSSSTAHAVLALNLEDGGHRRFVMVQLPEPTPLDSTARAEGFVSIAELSRRRIELAGEAMMAGGHTTLTGADAPNLGFRSYRLTDTNFSKWRVESDVEPGKLEQHLLSLRDSADDDATPDSLLTEILLRQGYSLTEQIGDTEVDGLPLKSVGGGLVLAYLDEHAKPTLEQLRAVLASSDLAKFIILEDAFKGDDALKTNLVQEAKSRNVELWTA
jgi:adenine-specific DNA-methyltransferase